MQIRATGAPTFICTQPEVRVPTTSTRRGSTRRTQPTPVVKRQLLATTESSPATAAHQRKRIRRSMGSPYSSRSRRNFERTGIHGRGHGAAPRRSLSCSGSPGELAPLKRPLTSARLCFRPEVADGAGEWASAAGAAALHRRVRGRGGPPRGGVGSGGVPAMGSARGQPVFSCTKMGGRPQPSMHGYSGTPADTSVHYPQRAPTARRQAMGDRAPAIASSGVGSRC